MQGGTSTGRRIDDACGLRAVHLKTALLNPYCLEEPPFRTDFPWLGSYIISGDHVQVNGTFHSLPGDALDAGLGVPSATVAPSLGRLLSGSTQFANLNVVQPGAPHGDWINQLDFRVGKILRFWPSADADCGRPVQWVECQLRRVV